MHAESNSTDELKFGSALVFAFVGLLITAILAGFLSVGTDWKPSDVVALVGVFTSLIGTLVGAFLGVQIGSSGRQKAERLANRALAALPPEKANEVLD
ncbi:hypothetical protein JHS3_27500 [Jeongeupia sp. HS-3]|uniref:hypothetical protein n=1 Tax=Jeongeupia sp. HS-3 TaxID=1009682 RepID=UPI0018A415E0|nr:hypothetical protein [Jeongeupia sp. HS-3]BCL77014.1 hypothetical protein JHS3_27500 [Jeongeupia sp. HS-3]